MNFLKLIMFILIFKLIPTNIPLITHLRRQVEQKPLVHTFSHIRTHLHLNTLAYTKKNTDLNTIILLFLIL